MGKREKRPSREVAEFASALEDWAAQGTQSERRQRTALLKWLLSRTVSRGFKDPEEDKYVVKKMDIEDIKIKEAVMRALAGYNAASPVAGWIRGPIWPKGYGS